MKYLMKKYPLLRLLWVLSCAASLAACGADQDGAAEYATSQNATRSVITTVGVLDLTLNSEYPSRSFYTGRVEPARQSDLGFELAGLLDSVDFDEGDRVAKGDVLARLDTDRLMAQLKEVEADVAQARAQSDLALSTSNRLIEAREFDGVSQQQLDEANNAAATSRAAVLAAESRLARVRVDVAKARLIAPYDAVILKRHHDEGQVLSPGQPVLSIQDTNELQVRIGVVGTATDQLEPGSAYTLIVRGQLVTAQLRSILPIRDAVARTIDAIFTLRPESGGDERSLPTVVNAGDLAQLELRRTVDAQGYWVPLTALAEGERGLWNAYALVQDPSSSGGSTRVVQSRAVEVLYQDGSRAFINGALQPDEQIVPDGLNRIVPGQRVSIVKGGF